MEKNDIAAVLDEIATLLELTGENPFKMEHMNLVRRMFRGLREGN